MACGNGFAGVDAALNTKLQTISGMLPSYNAVTVNCANASAKGIIYKYNSATDALLLFWINDTTCPTISGTSAYANYNEGSASACYVKLQGYS